MSCWTLTRNARQAAGIGSSIETLAKEANGKMHKLMGELTKENFPNIISVDYFNGKALSVVVYANSLKK